MAGAALAGWAGFNPLALRQGVRRRQALLLGALLAYLGILQGLLPGLQSVWVAPRLAAAYEAAAACEASRLASSGFREPSLVFLTASDTALLSPEEAAHFLQVDPACRLAAIEGRKEAAFLEALGEGAEGLISHAVIEGFNYADGDEVVITLYGLTHEP
jgi:TctA family transporter